MSMTAKIIGTKLVVEIDLETPTRSKNGTGPSMVVASSHGNQVTEATVNGKKISIGLNAYYKFQEA